jgi:5-methylcytosine-specific restriction protein B
MSIPNNINKEHLLEAIRKIDNEGIPKDGDSQYYDVDFNGKKYPPKVIVSYANIFANGSELDRKTFKGGRNTDCFILLEKYGFEIKNKDSEVALTRKIWIEKTLVNGREDRMDGPRALGKVLWSPQRDSRGADIYRNMRFVKPGDVILHLVDNKEFSGVSIVKDSYIETEGLINTEWRGPAYLINLKNFIDLKNKVQRQDVLNEKYALKLREIAATSEVFFNKDLNLRQGAYLTPCPLELMKIINQVYQQKSNESLPNMDSIEEIVFNEESSMELNKNLFFLDLSHSGLWYSNILVLRFISSLLTKPFVILTGLSGSGKTKLAQAFVKWICQDESQYRIVPVGADWTNREPLLGYPNALKPEEYVKPDSGVLDLIIQANNQRDLPHFLILDEMNLSHVERYFADFLSVMESKEEIPLYAEGTIENGVPSKLSIPSNFFIIGTVNIDETTNMFSPKVLDRANTIEFRVTQDEMKNFLGNVKDINMDVLIGKGAGMAKSFLDMAANKDFATDEGVKAALIQFFGELKKTGAEFGYRSATEILRLIKQLSVLDNTLTTNQKIDIAIMQKLLPKLHGSRRKLCPVLETLGSFCITADVKIVKDVFEKSDFDFNGANILYPLSLEKISRMYRGARDNGFASFAEA